MSFCVSFVPFVVKYFSKFTKDNIYRYYFMDRVCFHIKHLLSGYYSVMVYSKSGFIYMNIAPKLMRLAVLL